MNNFQREVLQQIKAGIDRARHEGVVVEYPRGALIDGEWVAWPFDSAQETAPAPVQSQMPAEWREKIGPAADTNDLDEDVQAAMDRDRE